MTAGTFRTATVLLAAGLSSRMGTQNKLLIEFDGEPLIRRLARTYLEAGTDVYAVTGHDAERVRAALADLPLVIVDNPDFADGQPASVRVGIDRVPDGYDAVLIALGDQVALTTDDIALLLDAFAESDRRHILIPHHQGQRGNPVVFPADIIAEIRADGHRIGCRTFIDANPELTRPYEAPNDHVTVDIDTPEDLQTFLLHFGQRQT